MSEPERGARADVVVVGAGVMGCASALHMARAGLRVVVLERSVPGAEASSAAAGMLGAQVECHAGGPFADLCVASRARFGAWSELVRELTGIDVEHRVCGVLRAAYGPDDEAALVAQSSWQRERGLRADMLTGDEARRVEPGLSREVTAALHLPDDARVDPPRWLKALRIGAERSGATFRSGAFVRRVVTEGGRARGVEIEGGAILEAAHVVLAAGSWSALVGGVPLASSAVRPARGQIVELLMPAPVTHGVVVAPGAYLSPRDDGRVLVGSTLEFVGFERGTTAGAVHQLLGAALRAVPALARADMGRTWSSFRPYTDDELPLVGPSSIEGLWLATGHYRNGILLGPITAEIVSALVRGEPPPFDVSHFAQR